MGDEELAAAVAEEAGALLLQIRASAPAGGLSGKELGAAGDRRSNDLILSRLAAARPGDAVLSEESADGPARLGADRVWIVDPLDGTREYALPGRSDWAVHVALWDRSRPAERPFAAAAVAMPALAAVYSTADAAALAAAAGGVGDSAAGGSGESAAGGSGGSAAGEVAGGVAGGAADRVAGGAAGGARLRILVSDSRPPAFAAAVAAAVGADLVPMGSAGAKAMAVLRGDADAYLHAGGQWEWDSAAPVGVLQAAGLSATRLDGTALLYNQPHPYLPDLVICRPELAGDLLAAIAAAGAA